MFGLFEKPDKQNNSKEASKISVLLIEDENLDRVWTERVLVKNHFKVLTAPNGKQGVSLAEQQTPDVILLDYYLPDINGLEVGSLLKKNSRTKHIPIIFISIVEEGDIILQFYETGVGFIAKPTTAEEIISEIEFALSEESSKNI